MKQAFYKSIIITIILITATAFCVGEPFAETTDGAEYSRSYQTNKEGSQNQEYRRPRLGGGPLMKALDSDNDKALSAEEISSASTALLALDKDGDGMISHSELRPEKPSSRQGARQQ